MRHGFMRWTWAVVLALVAGCDGIDLEQLVRQHAPHAQALRMQLCDSP